MYASLRFRYLSTAFMPVILMATAWYLAASSSDLTTNIAASDAAVLTATFYPVKDTWIDRLDPYRTWGSADYLRTGSSECDSYYFPTYAITMMKFDLSSIPQGALVLQAELHLYQLGAYGDPLYEPRYQLWVADRDWPEGATWQDQPSICGGVRYLWLPAAMGWKVWDLTDNVQDWVSGACPNLGFSVRSAEAPATPDVCNGRVFASREHANRPWLEVSYVLPSDTPTATGTSTATHTPTVSPRWHAYLPIVMRPRATPTPTRTRTPTRTPTRTLTPTPTEPAGDIEVTAWVSNPSPSQYSTVTVYGKITRGGVGIAGVPMHTTWRYKTTTSYCDGTSGSNGVASCSRGIGRATIGYYVSISVTFTYQNQNYYASTGFRPQ